MAVTEKDVRKVAKLARLKIAAEDENHLVGELNSILGWIDQLTSVNTEGVEPMAGAFSDSLSTPRRADEITDGQQADAILQNAPLSTGQGGTSGVTKGRTLDFFTVPRVVE